MESTKSDLLIRRIRTTDTALLGGFFEELASDAETVRFFTPHPLTREYAARLCATGEMRLDRYYLALYHGRAAAYAMLRGRDEGYAIPSWGGCVHPGLRSAGLGHVLMRHAVAECRAAGVTTLRLTVFKANQRGIHLYAKFGFVFQDTDDRSVVGLLNLSAVPALPAREPDRVRLQNWYAAGAAREAA
jgi:ribosomal protein S18 acetylase RimI-like enzyme